jgi:calcium-dependent protein kinase
MKMLSRYCILSEFDHRYTIIELLGKGSMGEVFKVKNNRNGEFLAAKAIASKALSSSSKQLLMNEIRIMRKLDHPNIMKIHEVHETSEHFYLIMDLMEHGDFYDYVSSTALNESKIKRIMYQLIQGLSYLEKHGIIHRDIKPSNLMVKLEGGSDIPTIVISDFGLACYKDEAILCKGSGTHGFMPPEVLISKTLDGIVYTSKVDMFAAGVIFFKLINKKDPVQYRPAEDTTLTDIQKKFQINFNSRLIREFNPEGVGLLKKMLALEPKDRVSASKALQHSFFASSSSLVGCFSASKSITNFN